MWVESNNGKQTFGEPHTCVMGKLGNITIGWKQERKTKYCHITKFQECVMEEFGNT
jgi:hypothetical protein